MRSMEEEAQLVCSLEGVHARGSSAALGGGGGGGGREGCRGL